jgi:hypothetical protein
MTMIQKTFTIPCTTKSIQDNDTDTLYLTGIANTGLEDLVGDVVTRQALESIAEQIPQHNLHMDHDHDWTGIIGRMTEGWVEEDGVHFKARILRERSNEIRSYLDQDIIMGASISGCCEYEENSVSDIVSWQLTEVSLTPIPCDQATLGSVVVAKSFVDAVRGLQEKIQENEGEKMAEEGTNEQVTPMLRLLTLAQYIPVMTAEEQAAIFRDGCPFMPSDIERWQRLKQERENQITDIFNKAWNKQRK